MDDGSSVESIPCWGWSREEDYCVCVSMATVNYVCVCVDEAVVAAAPAT